MKRKLTWILLNGLFSASIFYGFFMGVNGAKNLTIFWAWFVFISSLALFTESSQKTLKEKGRPIPAWIDVTYDVGIVCVFVYFSAFWTGTIYLIHMLLLNAAYAEAVKEK